MKEILKFIPNNSLMIIVRSNRDIYSDHINLNRPDFSSGCQDILNAAMYTIRVNKLLDFCSAPRRKGTQSELNKLT